MYTTLIKFELKALIRHFSKDAEKEYLSLYLDNSTIEECKNTIKSISRVTDLDTQLSKEIYLFTSEGGRGEYLQGAYSYLGSILPTSVDCERCFSMAPYVDYKIRSDNMLDALI